MAAVQVTRDRHETLGHWRAYLCEFCGFHHIGRRKGRRRTRLGADPELLMWGGWRVVIADLRENQSRIEKRHEYIRALALKATNYIPTYGDKSKY